MYMRPIRIVCMIQRQTCRAKAIVKYLNSMIKISTIKSGDSPIPLIIWPSIHYSKLCCIRWTWFLRAAHSHSIRQVFAYDGLCHATDWPPVDLTMRSNSRQYGEHFQYVKCQFNSFEKKKAKLSNISSGILNDRFKLIIRNSKQLKLNTCLYRTQLQMPKYKRNLIALSIEIECDANSFTI